MRRWMTYLLGVTLVALAAFGAYQVYSMTTQTACTCPEHSKSPNVGAYRHAILRA
jgi:hypothetical protein